MLYRDEAAAEYDRAFAHVSEHFVPFLLSAACVAPGMRVLDVATGTGLAAQAALAAVGPTGCVVATDVSPAMVEKARTRLGEARNVSVSLEDAQALSFPDASFDAVICSLGLMFFPNPQQGLSEFYRVLRPGGCVAVSVLTAPERSYNGRINIIIAPYLPSFAETARRTFALGSDARLRPLFEAAGFPEMQMTLQAHRFTLPSFDAYFGPFERGGGSTAKRMLDCRRGCGEEFGKSCDPICETTVGRFRSMWSSASRAHAARYLGSEPSAHAPSARNGRVPPWWRSVLTIAH
jgi:ubiquinone/menaquinone biosynthesis C-methylase UbiE